MDIDAFLRPFDLIDQADGLLRGLYFTLRGRGSAVIEFSPPDGMSAADMERRLWLYKIPTYGRQVLGRVKTGEGRKVLKFALRTTQTQRSWAEYVLLRSGALVWNLHDPRNATWAARHTDPPPAWAEGGQPPEPTTTTANQAPTESRVRRLTRELW